MFSFIVVSRQNAVRLHADQSPRSPISCPVPYDIARQPTTVHQRNRRILRRMRRFSPHPRSHAEHWNDSECLRQKVVMAVFRPGTHANRILPRQGRRNVATGEAQRNPWVVDHLRHPSRRAERSAVSRQISTTSVAPPGQSVMRCTASTGSASGDVVAAPLHPWLQSRAPTGAEDAKVACRFAWPSGTQFA